MIVLKYMLAITRLVIFAVSMFFTVGTFLLINVFSKRSEEDGYALRRFWMNYFMIKIGNLKVTTYGDHTRYNSPALFVSNHRSIADLLLYKYINANVVAKAEIGNYPIINKGGEATGILWVKRESRKSRANTLKVMKEHVLSGGNIHIFPEGTTTDKRNTTKFKRGTFKLSVETGVPVIPVTIEYKDLRKAWVTQGIFGHFVNIFGNWKTEVKVDFGEPMYGTDVVQLSDDVQQFINNKLHEMQVGWSISYPEGRDTKEPKNLNKGKIALLRKKKAKLKAKQKSKKA